MTGSWWKGGDLRMGVRKWRTSWRQLWLRWIHRKYIHNLYQQRLTTPAYSLVRRKMCLNHRFSVLQRRLQWPENRELKTTLSSKWADSGYQWINASSLRKKWWKILHLKKLAISELYEMHDIKTQKRTLNSFSKIL